MKIKYNKTPVFLLLTACLLLGVIPLLLSSGLAAEELFNPGDIDVINSIIDNCGLDWTKADPADGSDIPADWTGAEWSEDAVSKRITGLDISGKSLTGTLDMSGLISLVNLKCNNNDLTEIVLDGGAGYLYIDVSYNNIPDESYVMGQTIIWDDENFIFSPQNGSNDIVPVILIIDIEVPQLGRQPQDWIESRDGYAGTIKWFRVTSSLPTLHEGAFRAGNTYFATVVLTLLEGYIWSDPPPDVILNGESVPVSLSGTGSGNTLTFNTPPVLVPQNTVIPPSPIDNSQQKQPYAAAVRPSTTTFAAAQTGYSNAGMAQIITIENIGLNQITGLSATLNSDNFEISSRLSTATLRAGDTATISVRPVNGLAARYANYNGTLTITGNNGIRMTVNLSFTVTPDARSSTLSGDLNGDGKVDESDLLLMQRYFARPGVEIDAAAADLNGNGIVDMGDLILFLKYFK